MQKHSVTNKQFDFTADFISISKRDGLFDGIYDVANAIFLKSLGICVHGSVGKFADIRCIRFSNQKVFDPSLKMQVRNLS